LQGYYIFGALVAETILASVQILSAQTGGHMDASDLTKALQNHLARRGDRAHVRLKRFAAECAPLDQSL
jgi:hypothetical protein